MPPVRSLSVQPLQDREDEAEIGNVRKRNMMLSSCYTGFASMRTLASIAGLLAELIYKVYELLRFLTMHCRVYKSNQTR